MTAPWQYFFNVKYIYTIPLDRVYVTVDNGEVHNCKYEIITFFIDTDMT